MNNSIFRKKSIERISSPEQLNDYVRVSNPGVWMVLAAIVIILAGVCVWGIFGRLDTKINTVGVCKNGTLTCYVSDEKIGSVSVGMKLSVDGAEYEITSVSDTPTAVGADFDPYAMYIGGLEQGQWVCEVTARTGLADGTYSAAIITESVSPISFVMN